MRILQTNKRNLRIPKAEVNLWVRYHQPDATGKMKTILFHAPTETFHFSTQWQGPYPNFGQASDIDVDMREAPIERNNSVSNDYGTDASPSLDDEYDPPAQPENELSDSAIAICELPGSPPSVAESNSNQNSPTTGELNRSTAQFPGSVGDDFSMEIQLPIDGIYHRYLSRDKFESCYCYTGHNVIVMWDHHVDQNDVFQLNRSEIRVVPYGRTYFRDGDIVWISCDCEIEKSLVFRTLLKADMTQESIEREKDRIGSCTHAQLALRIITMNSPNLITHEDFRKLFDRKTNSIPTVPIPIDMKVLRKNSMKPIHLHFYEPEKLWVASYADQYGRFKHVSCSRTNKRYCRHTNYIRKIQEDTSTQENMSNEDDPAVEIIEEPVDTDEEGSEAADDENQLEGDGIPELKCISRRVIGDTLSDEQRAALASQAQGTQRETMRNLHPTICPDCNENLSTFYDHTSNYTVVFDISTAHVTPDVKVRKGYCCHCQKLVMYDGYEHCILNYDNTHLFTYNLLIHSMQMMASAGANIYAQWEAILQTYAFHLALPEERIKRWANLRNEFQYALRDFILLRQFDMKVCCDGSEGLIIDGTHLSMFSHFLKRFELPWQADTSQPVVSGSRRAERVLFRNAKLRRLIHKYSRFDNKLKGIVGLTEEEYSEVFFLLEEDNHPAFCLFTQDSNSHVQADVKEVEGEQILTCPKPINRFLSALSALVSPVCAIIPPVVVPIIRRIINHNSLVLQDRIILTSRCPLFLDFYDSILSVTNRLPIDIIPFLETLATLALAPFHPQNTHDINATPPTPQSSPKDEMYNCGYYYPSHPVIRKMLHYRRYDSRNESQCRKNTIKAGQSGPGTFLVFCAKHGMCIGFHVMSESESPHTMFEVLISRFPRVPRLLVYDNACNLLKYALKREPAFFKDCHMVVDGLHFADHTNCSQAFDIRKFPIYNQVNSSLVEQKNRRLRQLKSFLMYMKPDNFLTFLHFYMCWLNDREGKLN